MKAHAFFVSVEEMPVGNVDLLTGLQPFVIIAPHPDDETLGCAGLMAEARSFRSAFRVVFITDGRASHPNSVLYPASRLIGLRQQESRQAAACCGVPSDWLRFLDLRDSEVPLTGPVFDRTVDAVSAAIREISARSIFVTWRGDPHCDHEAAYAIARAAATRIRARLWGFPIWGWGLVPSANVDMAAPRGLRLDISRWREHKARAIACHRSQLTPLVPDDPGGFTLAPEMLTRFRGPFEHFIEEPA